MSHRAVCLQGWGLSTVAVTVLMPCNNYESVRLFSWQLLYVFFGWAIEVEILGTPICFRTYGVRRSGCEPCMILASYDPPRELSTYKKWLYVQRVIDMTIIYTNLTFTTHNSSEIVADELQSFLEGTDRQAPAESLKGMRIVILITLQILVPVSLFARSWDNILYNSVYKHWLYSEVLIFVILSHR